jgi:TRAP-type C4-dicarboxylate transport system substrate-binding protein
MQIFKDSTRKQQSLDSKIQALTAKETTSKAHMQVNTNKESRKKQAWRKPVSNQYNEKKKEIKKKICKRKEKI